MNPYMRYGFVNNIKHRLLTLNRDCILIVIGEKGSGKSYLSLKLAEEIDPEFNIDKVVFKPQEAFKLILGDKVKGTNKIKKGSAILFDEAGLELSKKEWYAAASKAMVQLAQSFRFLNIALIFTLPSMKYLDSGIPLLSQMIIKTTGNIDYVNKQVLCKPYVISHDAFDYSRSKPYYRKFPKRLSANGHFDITQMRVGMPSAELVEAYEVKKEKFALEKYTRLMAKLQDVDDKRFVSKYLTFAELKAKIISNPGKYIKEFKSTGERRIIGEWIKLENVNTSKVFKTIDRLKQEPEIQKILIDSKPL